jgi:hypothetical protein
MSPTGTRATAPLTGHVLAIAEYEQIRSHPDCVGGRAQIVLFGASRYRTGAGVVRNAGGDFAGMRLGEADWMAHPAIGLDGYRRPSGLAADVRLCGEGSARLAQVGEDGEDAPVGAGADGEGEFEEDLLDVGLDGALGDEQAVGDGPVGTTVAVFRCVAALPLSVMPWVAGDVTFRHLLSAAAGYLVPAASSRAL